VVTGFECRVFFLLNQGVLHKVDQFHLVHRYGIFKIFSCVRKRSANLEKYFQLKKWSVELF
ncbi:MAG: hypothetical protein R6W78_00035, partial [Bacteroidales bacterium]